MCIWVFSLMLDYRTLFKITCRNKSVIALAKGLKFPNASLATHSVRIAIMGTKRSTQWSSWITRSLHIHRKLFFVSAMPLPWGSMGKLTDCARNAVSQKTGKMHKKILWVKAYLQHEDLRIIALHRVLGTWLGIRNIMVYRKGNWYKWSTPQNSKVSLAPSALKLRWCQ